MMNHGAHSLWNPVPIVTALRLPRLLWIALLAVVVWLPGYFRRGLWEPDEARYAYVANEMLEDGHRFVLYRNGEPYAHKPPLMFWLMQAGAALTGGRVNSVSARLPSLLGAILTLWAVAGIGTLWDGRRTGSRAVLATASIFLIWKQGDWGQIDMLLCGLELTAVWLLLENDHVPRPWRPLGAFCCMGLAILAKGPVGLIIPVGTYVVVQLALRDGRRGLRWYWAWGIPLAVLFPLTWLLCAHLEGAPSSYLGELVFKQNISRAAGQMGHERPFYYFLRYLPADSLPWACLLPAAIIVNRKDEAGRRVTRQSLAWVLWVVLFFSLSASKRNLYILSAYPAVGLLIGAAWGRASGERLKTGAVGVGIVCLLLAVPAGMLVALPFVHEVPVRAWHVAPLAVACLVGLIGLALEYRRRGLTPRVFAVVAIVFLAAFALAGSVVLPAANETKAPVGIHAFAASRVPAGQTLLLYKMHGEIVALYAGRRGETVWDVATLEARAREQGHGVVVLHTQTWHELTEAGVALSVTDALQLGVGSKTMTAIAFATPR